MHPSRRATALLATVLFLMPVACDDRSSLPDGETPAETASRPAAPDFTLELGNGGKFTLSEEARPVFMVFWAEW